MAVMSRVIHCWALVLMALMHVGRAHGESPPLTGDVRCFVAAMSLLQATPNNEVRNAAVSSALYYLGRLEGRDPNLDLEKIVAEESQRMTPSDIRSELERCGKALSARGSMITKIGQKMTQTSNQQSSK